MEKLEDLVVVEVVEHLQELVVQEIHHQHHLRREILVVMQLLVEQLDPEAEEEELAVLVEAHRLLDQDQLHLVDLVVLECKFLLLSEIQYHP
jgi:hypothetical protein